MSGHSRSAESDGQLLVLEIEINRLEAISDAIGRTALVQTEAAIEAAKAEPHGLGHRLKNYSDWEENIKRVAKESGRYAAIKRQDEITEQTAVLRKLLVAIPAVSDAGRAAKVRVLLRHIMPRDFRRGLVRGDSDAEEGAKILADLCGADWIALKGYVASFTTCPPKPEKWIPAGYVKNTAAAGLRIFGKSAVCAVLSDSS